MGNFIGKHVGAERLENRRHRTQPSDADLGRRLTLLEAHIVDGIGRCNAAQTQLHGNRAVGSRVEGGENARVSQAVAPAGYLAVCIQRCGLVGTVYSSDIVKVPLSF